MSLLHTAGCNYASGSARLPHSVLPHHPFPPTSQIITEVGSVCIPPPSDREEFSLSFFPVTSVSEPGFSQLNFSYRLTPGADIQTQRAGRGAEGRTLTHDVRL